VAKEVYLLNQEDVNYSKEQILLGKVDVLLYLALPTDKLNYFLAHLRLAPVQLALGLGHPLSSGIRSIDYTIIPEAMFEPEELQQNRIPSLFPPKDGISCAFEAYHCPKEVMEDYETKILAKEKVRNNINSFIQQWNKSSSTSSLLDSRTNGQLFDLCNISKECYERGTDLYYTEQVVRFSSFGHYIENPLNYYEEYPDLKQILMKFQNYRSLLVNDFYFLLQHYSSSLESKMDFHHQNLSFRFSEKEISGIADIHEFLAKDYYPLVKKVKKQEYINENEISYSMTCEEINEVFMNLNSKDFSVSFQNLFAGTNDQISSPQRNATTGSTRKNSFSVIYPQIKAEYLGCYSSQRHTLYFPQFHYYNIIQHLKKYHPLVDEILLRLIHWDPLSRIIIKDSYELLLTRLWKRYNEFVVQEASKTNNNVRKQYKTLQELKQHFIFIPNNCNHFSYLVLLSISHVFLNPVPFGSGITSFEALIMNVPTIIYPKETSILHFNYVQIKKMFSTSHDSAVEEQFSQLLLSKIFLAESLTDYVTKAIQTTENKVISLNQLKLFIAKKKNILLHEDIVLEAVHEWGQFLSKFNFLKQ
jgi:hypothetical protein